MPRPRQLAKWTAGCLGLAQVTTIAALSVVDYRRKRGRQHRPFPTAPPRAVPVGDGEVTIYTKGRDLYDDMLQSIRTAQHSIFFETYLWKADRVGVQFKRALIEAAARGVKVHVTYDVFGNLVVKPSFYAFPPNVHVLPHRPWSGMRGPIVWRSPCSSATIWKARSRA